MCRQDTHLMHSWSPWAHTFRTLSHRLSETSKSMSLPSTYAILFKVNNSHRVWSLISWLSWPRGLEILSTVWESNNHACQFLPGHHPQGAVDSWLEHNPRLPMKKAYFLSLELSTWGTGFRFPTHLEVKEVFSGNVSSETPSLHAPLASLPLNKISPRDLIHSTGALIFANFVQGTPPDLVWTPERITNTAPQDCIYVHLLKGLLEGLTSNQPETRWLMRFLHMLHRQVLAHPQHWGHSKNKSDNLDITKVQETNQELEQG